MTFVSLKNNPKLWPWFQRWDYNFKLRNKEERPKGRTSWKDIDIQITNVLRDRLLEEDYFPNRHAMKEHFLDHLRHLKPLYPDDDFLYPNVNRYLRILKDDKIGWVKKGKSGFNSDLVKHTLLSFFMDKLIVLRKMEQIASQIPNEIFHERLEQLILWHAFQILTWAFKISEILDNWTEWEDNTYLSLFDKFQKYFWSMLDPENERNLKAYRALTEEEEQAVLEKIAKNWGINSAEKDYQ